MVEFKIDSTEDQGSTFYVNVSFLINGKTNRVKYQFPKKDLENDIWKEKLSERVEKEMEGSKIPLNINIANKKINSEEFKKQTTSKF